MYKKSERNKRNKLRTLFLALAWVLFSGCPAIEEMTDPDDTGAIPKPAPEISVIAGDSRLELRWTKAVTATGYEAYFGETDSPEAARRWYLIDVNESNLVKATITGLTNGTEYYLWVKAIYPHGTSDFSEAGKGIPIPPPSWAHPVVPVATAGDEVLDLSWEAAENAAAYEVYYQNTPVPPAEDLSIGQADADRGLLSVSGKTETLIPDLRNGQTYYMWVRGVNSAGRSAFSGLASATPVGATAPPAAPAVSVVGGDKRLTLSWKAVRWAKSYRIYCSTEESPPAEPLPESALDLTVNGQDLRVVIQSNITNDRVYYVWVIAVNSRGDSPYSQRMSAETKAKPAVDRDNNSFKIGVAAERFINEDQDNGDRLSRKKETALGDLVCDGAAWYAREILGETLDFVYMNGGIITGGLAKGDITVGSIKGILPYNEDQLAILTLKGSAVQELFDFAAKVRHGGGGGSGTGAWGMVSKEVRYTLDYTGRDNSDALLKDLTINGAPLDPNRDYRIATSSYLVDGGDGYWMFLEQGKSIQRSGKPVSIVVIDYIYAQDLPLIPQTDGRVTLIGGAVK
ncbi:MAG: 5'-nucleotidase C-terminal domain-containing protein [Treponema sp.]|jgi:hypothetical protein|nr:5'-nucleotidase C-terminal domain-containing protein [Treponema sp.]